MEVDGERLTPLDYAVIGQHQELAQLLIEHGALSISAVQDLAAICIQKVCLQTLCLHTCTLCCFALFVCLTLLASFFFPSHLSFKNVYLHVHVHVCT